MSHEDKSVVPKTPSLVERVGVLGLIKIGLGVSSFVGFAFFYTMLPIAGLQLLPFIFFGNVALVVGIADDLGAY